MTDINTVISRKAEAAIKTSQVLAQIAANQSAKSNQTAGR